MATILLVDDDENHRLTLSALLEDEGFWIQTAGSCREARGMLVGAGTADVILVDQHLGDGLGSDLLPVIRERHPRARVVLMSGTDASALPRLADAAFEKGRAFDELLGVLRRLLAAPAPGGHG